MADSSSSSMSGGESDADAHPRVHPSTDAAPLHGFSCAFARGHCGHDELFRPHYTRTNLRKGDKILRCFPHCCPDHVARSFCGASLHLDVRWSNSSAARAPDVRVFARFRVQDAAGLAPGDHVTFAEIGQSLQSENNPHGEWIPASAVGTNPREWRFEINHDARWFYHWESGVAKRHRLKHHVLDVYVLSSSFSPVSAAGTTAGDHQPLEVVAKTSSPPFRLISFRRATPQAVQALSVPRESKARVANKTTPRGMRKEEDENQEEKETRVQIGDKRPRSLPLPSHQPQYPQYPPAPPQSQSIPSWSARFAPPPPPRSRPSIADLTASIDRHVSSVSAPPTSAIPSPTVMGAQRLRRLFQCLDKVSASDTVSYMATFQRVYEDALTRAAGVELPVTTSPHRVAEVVQQMLLDAGAWHRRSGVAPLSAEVTAILCELLLWLSFDVDLHQAVAATIARDAGAVCVQSQLQTAFASFVEWLERHVDTFLHARGWRLEDIISIVEASHENIPESADDAVTASLRVCVAQLSDEYASQAKAAAATRHARHAISPIERSLPFGSRTPSSWAINGEWTCDFLSGGLAVQSASSNPEELSLLSLLALLRELGTISIRLDANAQVTTMDVVSLLNAKAHRNSGAQLTLDQTSHWCRAFPSGVSTTALPIGGLQWGDHSGEASLESEAIHCNLYAWTLSTPSTASLGRCFQLQFWTPSLDELAVRVCVSHAVPDVQSYQSLDAVVRQLPLCSLQQKLRLVRAWEPTVAAELRYVRIRR